MRKMEKRALICMALAVVLAAGMICFIVQFVCEGSDWASSPYNRAIRSNGTFSRGEVYDTNGKLILKNTSGKMQFNSDYLTRRALVHISGDNKNNVSTGINNVMAEELIGYSILNGTYSMDKKGKKINLTLDADVCRTACWAMGYRSGSVSVFNYKTGDIICAMSSPGYDPAYPPEVSSNDKSGLYVNRVFSIRTPPGSTFKTVTTAAALENGVDPLKWTFTCRGIDRYAGSDRITCMSVHGHENLEDAFAVSCNCAYGRLTNKIGSDAMEDAVRKYGLTTSYNISGIRTKRGHFVFPESLPATLGWAGVGQAEDQINPAGMMIFMGSIANGGEVKTPTLVKSMEFSNGIPASLPWSTKTVKMMDSVTADTVKKMLRNNVEKTYGVDSFPGLEVCAKSGTAEVDKTKEPNAVFAGFVDDEEHPYAFFVYVENGGDGTSVAGTIANTVLQSIVQKEE